MDDQTLSIVVEILTSTGVSGVFLYLLVKLWNAYQTLLAKQTSLHLQYVTDSGAIRDKYVAEITKIHATHAIEMSKMATNYVTDLKQVFANHVLTLEKLLAEERNESQLERSRVVSFADMQSLPTPIPDNNKTQILHPEKLDTDSDKEPTR